MKPEDFTRRRRQVMRMAGDGAIVVVPAATECIRSRDTAFPFRQHSDFYYLTGFCEPDAVLALIPGRDQGEQIMFCRERDAKAELWDGKRAGLEGAVADFQMDDAFPFDDIDEILPNLIEGRSRVYYSIGRDDLFDQRMMGWIRHIRAGVKRGAKAPGEFVSLEGFLHDMRLFKTRAEIKAMRQSAQLAAEAHRNAMRACQPGMHEYELAATITHTFMRAGAESAYQPIVGGGANGCVLHYVTNRDVLKDGDLVLIDAGAELNYYASDITRTFPVNGVFSARQRDLYSVVLASQEAAIDAIKPGATWTCSHDAATTVITRGLVDLGILSGDPDALIEDGAHSVYYPHKTGHWLGIDVHDVGDYSLDGVPRVLEKGMAMTVEPGVYISPGSSCDKAWHGIGIRIEDDIVVTKDGCHVLSEGAPKTIEDIEAWMHPEPAARHG